MSFDFQRECDDIIRSLTKRSYLASVSLIDSLEKKAAADGLDRDARVSCADLRLDAALGTKQPAAECLQRYDELVAVGAGPTARLLKACILVREVRPISEAALDRLGEALAVTLGTAPIDLTKLAERLLQLHRR